MDADINNFDFSTRNQYFNALVIFSNRSVVSIEHEMTNQSFHNLLPEGQPVPSQFIRLLGLHTSFAPTPKAIPPEEYMTRIDKLVYRIRTSFQFAHNNTPMTALARRLHCPSLTFVPQKAGRTVEEALQSLRQAALDYFSNLRFPRKSNLPLHMRTALRELRHHPTFMVVSTDKNLGPAVILRTDYERLTYNHLRTTTYKLITRISVRYLIRKVKMFHRTLTQSIPRCDHKSCQIIIYKIDDTRFARFYALLKVHKPTLAIRPIVSACNSPTAGLSTWLDVKLRPYVTQLHSYIQDSNAALTRITNTTWTPNQIMFTADVVSLYTTIPLITAYQRISNILRINEDPLHDHIMTGLKLLMEHNFFTFNGQTWHQQNGTAMGTPCAPTFANLFLGHTEETVILPKYSANLACYLRYIDDVFVIWNVLPTDNVFLLNRFKADLLRQTGVKWTFSPCESTKVEFLDLVIHRNPSTFSTSTHQKSMNLYLYIASQSAHPPGVLKGLIFGLLQKLRVQNTLYSDFLKFAQLLFTRLTERGYSPTLLRNIYDRFTEKQRRLITSPTPPTPSTPSTPSTSQPRQPRQPQRPNVMTLTLPYHPYGPTAADLRSHLPLSQIENLLKGINFDRLILGWNKAPTIRTILGGTNRLSLTPTATEDSHNPV